MTQTHPIIPFDELCDLLMPLGALNSPAELHGMLCGKLSGGQRLDTGAWARIAWDFLDLPGDPQGEAGMAIAQLYNASLRQLNDDDLGLSLLLPNDDVDLDQRTLALGQWCHGFLSGFGSAGIEGDCKLSAEASDALRDFAAIVQVGAEEDSEEAEGDYTELVEYVRMATLSLFMEFGAKISNPEDLCSGAPRLNNNQLH